MRRISLAPIAASLASSAVRRMDAALARQFAADSIVLFEVDGTHAVVELPILPPEADRSASPDLGLIRALVAWLVSWVMDGLSRVELMVARSVERDRALARQRPAARPRDGPA